MGRLALVQARGSTVFQPNSLSGLVLWLDAERGLYQDAAMSTPVSADGSVVGGWADQSGSGNHATQATAGSKPLYKASIANGRPVVRFDGEDDYLGLGNPAGLQLSDALAFVAVFIERGAPVSYPSILGRGANGWAWGLSNEGGNVGKVYLSRSGSAPYVNSSTVPDVGTTYILGATKSGLNSYIYVNGTQEGTSGASPDFTFANNVQIGQDTDAAAAINGDIAELLIYNRALSDSERQSVESYLNTRYAIY